jgi:hypothetical protein
MHYTAVFLFLAGLSLASCGPKKQAAAQEKKDSVITTQKPVDGEPLPMILTVDPLNFTSGFDDIPFGWNEEYIRSQKIKKISWHVTGRSGKETYDNGVVKSWTFNENGQPAEYIYNEHNTPIHAEVNAYKNGKLVQSVFTNHLGGWERTTVKTYDSQGRLTGSTSDDGDKETYKYTDSLLTQGSIAGESRNYRYENGKLAEIKDVAGKWTKIYTYDEQGRWTGLTSNRNYSDSYVFTYNPHGQIEKIHWEEDKEPLFDILFTFDEAGRLLTIVKKGYIAAASEEERMEFSYE